MTAILRRDEVVQRQAKKNSRDVEQAVQRVNKMLEAAVSLPCTIAASELGTLSTVRAEVLRLLRDAGWRCEFRADQRDGDYYELT